MSTYTSSVNLSDTYDAQNEIWVLWNNACSNPKGRTAIKNHAIRIDELIDWANTHAVRQGEIDLVLRQSIA